MDALEDFVEKLKDSIEEHSAILKRGKLFHPKYLKGKIFTKTFHTVIKALSNKINLRLIEEYKNAFLGEYKIGNPQKVDYCFVNSNSEPIFFLEQESLDRAQLYLFTDGHVSENVPKDNDNKLWYYYGTLGNHFTVQKRVPQHFIFLLFLPDEKVMRYQLRDIQMPYCLFDPSLARAVFESPFKFYDLQIKASARAFLRSEDRGYFKINGDWKEVEPEEFQKVCELVFVTCTGDKLILSRGRHMFDPAKETKISLAWR